MRKRNVEVFLGTLERPNDHLVDAIIDDVEAGAAVVGVGFQWAGKGALPGLRSRYPHLRMYQTEQECGDGANDWRYCRYAWTQMRHYLSNGVSAYTYWNIALQPGGRSRWGWAQNSLVTVDPTTHQCTYNHEYYLLRHVSGFVQSGAKVLRAVSYSG